MSPSGDVKRSVGRSRGHYGGSYHYYDDHGRGDSKNIWDWFHDNWEAAGCERSWLMTRSDAEYYMLFTKSVERFGLMDIAYGSDPGYYPGRDTRAHKMVLKHQNEGAWTEFYVLLISGYNRETARKEQVSKTEAEERQGRWDAERRQREAEAAIVDRAEFDTVQPIIEATAGTIRSDLATTAFIQHDVVHDYGDAIEDIVDAYHGSGGFLDTTQKATDSKLQISVSLDLSNSMYYNDVHQSAADAFLMICMSLKAIKDEYPDDIFISFFTFSDNGWEGKGKSVSEVVPDRWGGSALSLFGEFEFVKPSAVKRWVRGYGTGIFTGEDTYIAPLLSALEKWEAKSSSPGAVKLDIVITDAVFEHPKDIRESDVIQERRDGQLQTVFLNFMDPSNWLACTLPKRCLMVKVGKDNLAGILRNLVAEFLGASL